MLDVLAYALLLLALIGLLRHVMRGAEPQSTTPQFPERDPQRRDHRSNCHAFGEDIMLRLSALAALLLAIAIPSAPVLAQEHAKWFVLRNHEVGNCWTAVLIRIDGQYINTFAQKAGGPYDSENEAVQRQKVLEDQGTCQKQ